MSDKKAYRYKLLDLQQYFKSAPDNVQSVVATTVPLTSNYLIENTIDRSEIKSSVVEVFSGHHTSETILAKHLKLTNVTDNCYLQFTEDQVKHLGLK